jgi:hypothetical protein
MKLAPIYRDHVRQFVPLGNEGKQLASCVRVRDLASRPVAFARVSIENAGMFTALVKHDISSMKFAGLLLHFVILIDQWGAPS